MIAGAMMLVSTCVGAVPKGSKCGRYVVLSASPKIPPPLDWVEVRYGPTDRRSGTTYFWWQLECGIGGDGAEPLFQLRALTSRDPLSESSEPLLFKRYIIRIPQTGECLEYRNMHTGEALLPGWKDFERYFVPRRVMGSREQEGFPNTLEYLGHTLSLRTVSPCQEKWSSWADAKLLSLDPELLVGTGRNFKDAEGHRLPDNQSYTFVEFTGEDYRLMIDTGFNLFIVKPAQEEYVRSEPVFYVRGFGEDRPLVYPADLYRSNFLGATMFMDEPTMILSGDEHINTKLMYFSDFASVIQQRVRSRYNDSGHYGAYRLEASLKSQGVDFGDMRLMQYDYPSWETALETTFYQMAGGCNGLVHEGRYQLSEFQDGMDRWTGVTREYTAEEYLRYQFALLRGGTRPFGKFWGTSIYGQADPKLSPLAVTLAYDMGARYIWFWTSDHGHHLPWNEQIDLVRHLRAHAAKHPRASIFGKQPVRDKAIVIPYGYFLSLAHLGANIHGHLWWVRELDREGRNESSQRYRRVMERAHKAVIEAFDNGENFDITVDDGREITGYRSVVRISDSE